jgi:hypothetical protein
VVDQVTTEFLTASQHRDRRRRRITQTIAATMTLLLLIATGTAVIAVKNADRADQNATQADQQHALALSRQLATQVLPDQPATSQRLGAVAFHIARTSEAADLASTVLADYRSILPHTDPVSEVVFSPDGKLLATASEDKSVRLWNPPPANPSVRH